MHVHRNPLAETAEIDGHQVVQYGGRYFVMSPEAGALWGQLPSTADELRRSCGADVDGLLHGLAEQGLVTFPDPTVALPRPARPGKPPFRAMDAASFVLGFAGIAAALAVDEAKAVASGGGGGAYTAG